MVKSLGIRHEITVCMEFNSNKDLDIANKFINSHKSIRLLSTEGNSIMIKVNGHKNKNYKTEKSFKNYKLLHYSDSFIYEYELVVKDKDPEKTVELLRNKIPQSRIVEIMENSNNEARFKISLYREEQGIGRRLDEFMNKIEKEI